MTLGGIPLFRMMSEQMTWLNQRQKVLSQNIANADTPNYVPKDLVRLDFADLAKSRSLQIKIRATNPRHIGQGPDQKGNFRTTEDKGFESSPSGNSVVLEEEMMKVSESQIDYELITRLYRKHVGMIRTALGRNR